MALAWRPVRSAAIRIVPLPAKGSRMIPWRWLQSRRASAIRLTGLTVGWGQVHLVTVVARGFEYEGICYDSLSEIARLITGTRWSGPLFFGLRSKKSSSPEVNREQ
jgi:hypothetical protein